jgi:hypothetical protein
MQPLVVSPTALMQPTAQTIETTFTLDFGAKLADGNYVLKSSQSAYYIEVATSVAEAFLNLKRADLLVPPTATPTVTPTLMPSPTAEVTAAATAPAALPAAPTATPTLMPTLTPTLTTAATAEATAASTPQ